jgi:hypothetical protein
MKIKGLLIAVVLLAGLSGALWWSNRHPPSADATKAPGAPETGPAMIADNQDDIVKFDLKKDGAEEAVLVKDAAGNWHTTSPIVVPVASDAISGLMTALAKLTSDRVVEDKTSPADLMQFGLDHPGFETAVTTKDGKTQTLLIGGDAPAGRVSYAMLQGDPHVYTIPGYVKDIVDRHPRDLRDKRLVTTPEDKINRVELDAKQKIIFVRDNGQWRMDEPKLIRADSSTIDSYVDNLTTAEMDASAISQPTKQADDGYGGGMPVATVKVTGDSGTETLEIRKNKADYYAKPSDAAGGVYKVSPTTSEGLIKTPDDFRDKKLFDFGIDDPDKVELHVGQKATVIAKFGDDWHLGDEKGPKVDTTAAQELVGKLRSLVATKFPDSGFGSAYINVTVTSGGGKHVEKIAISRSGDRVVGKREGDSLLYELDPTLVDEVEKSADAIKPPTSK